MAPRRDGEIDPTACRRAGVRLPVAAHRRASMRTRASQYQLHFRQPVRQSNRDFRVGRSDWDRRFPSVRSPSTGGVCSAPHGRRTIFGFTRDTRLASARESGPDPRTPARWCPRTSSAVGETTRPRSLEGAAPRARRFILSLVVARGETCAPTSLTASLSPLRHTSPCGTSPHKRVQTHSS